MPTLCLGTPGWKSIPKLILLVGGVQFLVVVGLRSLFLEGYDQGLLKDIEEFCLPHRATEMTSLKCKGSPCGIRKGREAGRYSNKQTSAAKGVYRWLCICQSECLICKRWKGRLQFQIFKGSRTVSKQLPKAMGEILTGKKNERNVAGWCCYQQEAGVSQKRLHYRAEQPWPGGFLIPGERTQPGSQSAARKLAFSRGSPASPKPQENTQRRNWLTSCLLFTVK